MGNGDGKKIEQAPALDSLDQAKLEQMAKDAEKKNFDTSTDMNQIKTNIDSIKKSVTDLKKDMNDFEKNKSTLTKEIVDTREKEIEVKKAEIEQKKKETQELIAKIRKERVDLKLETLDDATKALLIEQKAKDETALVQYEKDLQTIQPEKKGFREKIKDGAANIRGWAKENPRKTGGIAIGATLLIGWIGGWFKSKDEDEEDEDGNKIKKKHHKKKSFWNHGVGKFLKIAGIAVAGFFGIKRLLSQFNKGRGADTVDTSKTQVESYRDWSKENKEGKEQYEAIGDNVDNLYGSIFKKEIDNGREDDADMSTTSDDVGKETKDTIKTKYKGVVPFCMDNGFSSVESMLSETGIEVDIWGKDFAAIKAKILAWVKSGISYGLVSFLSVLPSFLTFGSTKDDIETKVNKRLDSGRPEDRIKELKFFFREEIRMITYLNQKRAELMKKIAEKEFAISKSGFDSVEEAMKDDERMKKRVYEDTEYLDFQKGRILNATYILQKEGIFNGEIDKDTQSIVTELDDERNEILDSDGKTEDVISRCQTDMKDDQKLTFENAATLSTSCESINDDIEKELEPAIEESAWNARGDRLNTASSNQREILKNSPILSLLKEIRVGLGDFKTEIANGKITSTDLESLKKFVNEYFALKKELQIGVFTFQEVKDNDGNIFLEWPAFMRGSIKNLGCSLGECRYLSKWKKTLSDLIAGATGLMVGAGIPIFVIRTLKAYIIDKNGTETLVKDLTRLPRITTKSILYAPRMINGKYFGPSWMIRNVYFSGEKGPLKLAEALANGQITLEKATEIVNGTQSSEWAKFGGVKESERLKWFKVYGGGANIKTELVGKSFDPKRGEVGSTMPELKTNIDIVVENFDNKSWNFLLTNSKKGGSTLTNTINLMNEYKKLGLSGTKDTFFKMVMNARKLNSAIVSNFIKNVNTIDVSKLTPEEIEKFADKIAKKLTAASTADEINAYINTLKNTVNTRTQVTEEEIKTVAAYLSKNRYTNKGIPEGFEKNGKFEKYAPEFKSRYEVAVEKTKTDLKAGEADLDALDKELAERLLRDGNKLVDIMGGEYANVTKMVEDDIKFLTRQKNSINFAKRGKITAQIKSLEEFKSKIPSFVGEDFSKLKTLEGLKIKPRHMVEIWTVVEDDTSAIAKVFKKPNATLTDIVEALQKDKKTFKIITDDTIKIFEEMKKLKVAEKVGEEVVDIFKSLAKFLKFIPK